MLEETIEVLKDCEEEIQEMVKDDKFLIYYESIIQVLTEELETLCVG